MLSRTIAPAEHFSAAPIIRYLRRVLRGDGPFPARRGGGQHDRHACVFEWRVRSGDFPLTGLNPQCSVPVHLPVQVRLCPLEGTRRCQILALMLESRQVARS